MDLLENMPEAAEASLSNISFRRQYYATQEAKLPHNLEFFAFQNFSDEVISLHLEKLIFIPHFLQAACSSSVESCSFSNTVDIIIVSSASDVTADVLAHFKNNDAICFS